MNGLKVPNIETLESQCKLRSIYYGNREWLRKGWVVRLGCFQHQITYEIAKDP
mgnify:CR=1 FL=1